MSEMVVKVGRLARRGMWLALVGLAGVAWFTLLDLSWLAFASGSLWPLLFLWTLGLFVACAITWMATESFNEWWRGERGY